MADLEVLALDTTVPQIRAPGAGDGYQFPRNVNFNGTGLRITGDFSNATLANRLAFQTSTTNGNTTVYALPNGTSQISSFSAVNNSDPTNASITQLLALSTESSLRNAISGTGTYLPMTFYTGGSERMRLDTSGNLGIGTTPSGARLDILTAAGTAAIQKLQTGSNAAAATLIFGQIGSVGWNTGITATAGDYQIAIDGGQTAYTATRSGISVTNHIFSTGGTERMRIDSSGNVGIGRAPNYTLDVYRSGTTTPTIAAANDNIVNVLRASGSTEAVIGPITSHPLVLLSANTERMRIDATGNVGIGTASPSGNLQVSGANPRIRFSNTNGTASTLLFGADSGQMFLGAETNAPIYFITNNTERMRIDSSGNVGIGTASPGTTLEVFTGSTTNGIRIKRFTGNYYSELRQVDSPEGLAFLVGDGSTVAERMRITGTGNVIAGSSAALATNATDGFLYVPTCAGTPTGTPTAITGMAPIVVNTTNNKLYFYSGGAWRDAGP